MSQYDECSEMYGWFFVVFNIVIGLFGLAALCFGTKILGKILFGDRCCKTSTSHVTNHSLKYKSGRGHSVTDPKLAGLSLLTILLFGICLIQIVLISFFSKLCIDPYILFTILNSLCYTIGYQCIYLVFCYKLISIFANTSFALTRQEKIVLFLFPLLFVLLAILLIIFWPSDSDDTSDSNDINDDSSNINGGGDDDEEQSVPVGIIIASLIFVVYISSMIFLLVKFIKKLSMLIKLFNESMLLGQPSMQTSQQKNIKTMAENDNENENENEDQDQDAHDDKIKDGVSLHDKDKEKGNSNNNNNNNNSNVKSNNNFQSGNKESRKVNKPLVLAMTQQTIIVVFSLVVTLLITFIYVALESTSLTNYYVYLLCFSLFSIDASINILSIVLQFPNAKILYRVLCKWCHNRVAKKFTKDTLG